MNRHNIVNLKCPCSLFRYPNLNIQSQALFNHHRASAFPLRCGSEDNKKFQNPTYRPLEAARQAAPVLYGLVWHSDWLLTCWLPKYIRVHFHFFLFILHICHSCAPLNEFQNSIMNTIPRMTLWFMSKIN